VNAAVALPDLPVLVTVAVPGFAVVGTLAVSDV
jgi:hypothetical protein